VRASPFPVLIGSREPQLSRMSGARPVCGRRGKEDLVA
jgi:hypothetical protein